MFLLQSDIFAWDLILLLSMTVTLSLGIVCAVWMKRNSEKLVQRTLIGLLGIAGIAGFLTVFYASFIEPKIIVVTEQTLIQPGAPSLKIAIVSDLHVGPYKGKDFIERAVNRINATLPDIVLFPGDFIFTHSAKLTDLEPLGNLHAPMGVFAVLGNHDLGEYLSLFGRRYTGLSGGDHVAAALRKYDVTVLRNISKTIPIADGMVAVAGIDDMWTGHFDLDAAMKETEKSSYSILLSHNPSIVDDPLSMQANLVVSGHTHGGQLRLPGIGPLPELPTTLGNGFDQGLFPMDADTTLAITRGIGESTARPRLLAWPEILLITLKGRE